MVSDTIRRGLGRFSGRSQGSPRRGLRGALVAPDRRGCNEKETTMRKSITAAAVAASLTVGGLSGAALGTPSLAGASDAERSGWVEDALEPLVADGTITADQADAVEDALQDARPERRGPGPGLEAAAEALGMTDDELRDALDRKSTRLNSSH